VTNRADQQSEAALAVRRLADALAAFPPAQQYEFVGQLDAVLKAAGIDLALPTHHTLLAEILGLEMVEIARAVDELRAHAGDPTTAPPSSGIALIFIAAALIFAPAAFQTIGGTLFEQAAVTDGIDGLLPFR
jgi:hypothetical protein